MSEDPFEILQPEGWARPIGYSNGIAATGRLVFVAGQIGWNPETSAFETDDFAAQTAQALRNVLAVLKEAGAEPRHVVRMTWYITDKQAYLDGRREIGQAWREIMGKHFPTMAVVEVSALIEDKAKVEIEATAVTPVRLLTFRGEGLQPGVDLDDSAGLLDLMDSPSKPSD